MIRKRIFSLCDHLGNTRVSYGVNVYSELQTVYAADYFPYGKVLREYIDGEGGDRFLTTAHERDKETGLDYRGARYYDSDMGRFLSLDPSAEKYPMLTSYSYVGGMVTVAIDPDGKDIVVPLESNRKSILEMIHIRAAGEFAFDDAGKLYLVKAIEGETRLSSYYRDKLVEAINNDTRKIEIVIRNNTKTPTYGEDGKSLIKNSGTLINIDRDYSGGVTFGEPGTDQLIIISGNEFTGLLDTEGKPLRDQPADIIAHELVGHAIPNIVGKDTGNAVDNENKIRKEYKEENQEGESPLRTSDPLHTE